MPIQLAFGNTPLWVQNLLDDTPKHMLVVNVSNGQILTFFLVEKKNQYTFVPSQFTMSEIYCSFMIITLSGRVLCVDQHTQKLVELQMWNSCTKGWLGRETLISPLHK